jgi:5-methylcytosine-specific restriction endonuclease McrA
MNWTLLRLEVLKRDKYQCRSCGLKFPKFDIHHINGRNVPGCETIENLITLCRGCHRRVQADKQKHDRRMGRIKYNFNGFKGHITPYWVEWK